MRRIGLLAGMVGIGVSLAVGLSGTPAAAAWPIGYTVTANHIPIYRSGVIVAYAGLGDCFSSTGGAGGWAYGVDETINVNGSIQTQYLQISGC
jgi:hypothetical protein